MITEEFLVPPETLPGHKPRRGRETPSGRPVPELDFYYADDESSPCSGVCTGTAFSIDGRGLWLTAKHVVDHCRHIFLEGAQRLPVTKVLHHPIADLSLLETPGGGPTLALNLENLRDRQDGYHIGYPAGTPGSVHSRLLGRTQVRRGELWREPVIAWAEVRRVPAYKGSLGGISGGAVLNAEGDVVGVTTLEEPRRGRIISAAPQSLSELLSYGEIVPGEDGSAQVQPLSPGNFSDESDRLRAIDSVAQVVCRATA